VRNVVCYGAEQRCVLITFIAAGVITAVLKLCFMISQIL